MGALNAKPTDGPVWFPILKDDIWKTLALSPMMT